MENYYGFLDELILLMKESLAKVIFILLKAGHPSI